MSSARLARQLLRSQHHGVLSTLSVKLEGYPFGSVVDYLVDHEARPVFLISALAEHTRNIDHDPRVSLLSSMATHDVQASPRLTFSGLAQRLDTTKISDLQARYLRYFPDAARYLELDFFFYRIEPVQLRYIGGPGSMCWLTPEDYTPPLNSLAQDEAIIIEHMNQEHNAALLHYCQLYHGIAVQNACMLGIDCDGFDLRADSKLLRFEFTQPVVDAHSARHTLITMAQAN